MGSITTLYLHQTEHICLGEVGKAKQALIFKRKKKYLQRQPGKIHYFINRMDYFHSLLLVDGVNFIHQPEQK